MTSLYHRYRAFFIIVLLFYFLCIRYEEAFLFAFTMKPLKVQGHLNNKTDIRCNMTLLLSHLLFGHCSINKDDTTESLLPIDTTPIEIVTVNPTTSLPMVPGTLIDVGGNAYGSYSFDTNIDVLNQNNLAANVVNDDEFELAAHDRVTSGFMLFDDTFSTFDDTSGATDWGVDISLNTTDDW